MYQCKAGHLAIHKYLDKRQKEKKIRTREWYTFLMLKNAGAVLTVSSSKFNFSCTLG